MHFIPIKSPPVYGIQQVLEISIALFNNLPTLLSRKQNTIPSWVAGVKAEPSSASKRRSPVQPTSQPAAKKGRLLRQKSPPTSTVDASMDSDETMEECVSPRRTAKTRKNAVESDNDEDYVVPGQPASQRAFSVVLASASIVTRLTSACCEKH